MFSLSLKAHSKEVRDGLQCASTVLIIKYLCSSGIASAPRWILTYGWITCYITSWFLPLCLFICLCLSQTHKHLELAMLLNLSLSLSAAPSLSCKISGERHIMDDNGLPVVLILIHILNNRAGKPIITTQCGQTLHRHYLEGPEPCV